MPPVDTAAAPRAATSPLDRGVRPTTGASTQVGPTGGPVLLHRVVRAGGPGALEDVAARAAGGTP